VETKKRVLIVTDGTDSIQVIAKSITAALTGCKVKTCAAESFAGTDLLAAQIFFLGCEKPRPASFAYLSQLLAHINLAGRPCGVFSSGGSALKYLCGLVKDSEAALGEPLLAGEGEIKPASLKKWLKGIAG
jgi:hypothetical protein